MSAGAYSKFGPHSDVSVLFCDLGYFECLECKLAPSAGVRCMFYSTSEILKHLIEHKTAGHEVQVETARWLQLDARKNDKAIRAKAQGRLL